ncbi:MAG: response regulator, partial [Lentisphaeraceae bacterium]|nr:response regulator [Lentisphaeraceae bacterium]
KIFGSFAQVIGHKTASYGCTGLGLSICLHLIEMMSGTVKLESIVGQGAHFTIQFPEVEISVAKPLKLGDLGDSAITFSPAKILIVDDIDYNRELLTSFMEDYVFEFCQARNGQEAIDKALLFKPDLILMDMKMPVMDGYESTRLMRQDSRFDDIRIVAVTASALKDDVEEIRKICDGYLAKPLKRQQLILELAKHLKHENVEKKLEKTADTVKYSLKEKREFLHFCQEKVSPLVVNLRESPGNFNTMREACDLLKGSLPVYQDDSFIKWQEGFLEACNSFDNERISKLCEAWSVVLKKLQ